MTVKSTCDNHAKMVHKTELQWMLGIFIAIMTSVMSLSIYSFATKTQVTDLEKKVDREVRLYERIESKLDSLDAYIRANPKQGR